MTMDELMEQILEILPEAVFMEDRETGEIVISTALVENLAGKPLERVQV